jgi:hypothetical protein
MAKNIELLEVRVTPMDWARQDDIPMRKLAVFVRVDDKVYHQEDIYRRDDFVPFFDAMMDKLKRDMGAYLRGETEPPAAAGKEDGDA